MHHVQQYPDGKQRLWEQPCPPALKDGAPQLSVDLLDPCDVGAAPSTMFPVRRDHACLALRSSWSGAPASVQLAAVPTSNGGVLAWGAPTGFGEAAFTRPIGTKTGCMASFN